MASRLRINKKVKVDYIGHGRSDFSKTACESLVQESYNFLYPKIWELINNKRYFTTSKKNGALYAKGQEQHCFYLQGRIPGYENRFMKKLHSLFCRGRLKRHTMPYVASWDGYENIQITPYVYIRKKMSTYDQDEGLFCNYGIYSIYHTLGFNTMFENSPFDHMQEKYVHNEAHFFHLTWHSKAKMDPQYRIRMGVDHLGARIYFADGVMAERFIFINTRRFNIELYNFLKSILHIQAIMLLWGGSEAEQSKCYRKIVSCMETGSSE